MPCLQDTLAGLRARDPSAERAHAEFMHVQLCSLAHGDVRRVNHRL